MQCNKCKKNEATIHLMQIVDGKELKVDLCAACAEESGLQDTTGFSLADLLVGDEVKKEGPGARCPVCGLTQADFKKTGRLGCATCWETFAVGLAPLLKAMHKGDHHVGKVPTRAAHTLVISENIRLLSAELDKAVRAEKYEEAAVLRDKIRELEAKLQASDAAKKAA
jgi:protein arginine kinase activator